MSRLVWVWQEGKLPHEKYVELMNSFRGEIADFSLTQGCLGLEKKIYPT